MKELYLNDPKDLDRVVQFAEIEKQTGINLENLLISGEPGTGKTSMAQTFVSRLTQQLKRTIIIDPDNEYSFLTKSLGGYTEEFAHENIVSYAERPNWQPFEREAFMNWAKYLSDSAPQAPLINWTTLSRIGFEPWDILGLLLVAIQKRFADTVIVDECSLLLQEPYVEPLINLAKYAKEQGVQVVVICQAKLPDRAYQQQREMGIAFPLHVRMRR